MKKVNRSEIHPHPFQHAEIRTKQSPLDKKICKAADAIPEKFHTSFKLKGHATYPAKIQEKGNQKRR